MDTERFHFHRLVDDTRHGASMRHWIAKDGIHLNYRHALGFHDGVLSIEVALSHWTKTPRNENPTMIEYQHALDRINDWIAHMIGYVCDIRQWICSRVDYCFNLCVDDARPYLAMLSQMWCGSLSRVNMSNDEGVVWKNDSRWIKFYNKNAQLGLSTHQTLRYEVSNHSGAVRYMCKNWFGCARTVVELLHPVRALYVLHRYWTELGLDQSSSYDSDIALHQQLSKDYGSSATTALGTLRLIEQYVTDAHKHELISKATFYRWRKSLRSHGYLSSPAHALPVLLLQYSFFLTQYAQNLGFLPPTQSNPPQKIWWENFGLKIEPSEDFKEVLHDCGVSVDKISVTSQPISEKNTRNRKGLEGAIGDEAIGAISE
jgi:hypothetical protein